MYFSINLPKEREGIKIGEYFSKKQNAALLSLPILLIPTITEAAVNTDAIIKAFDPLIDLTMAVGYPLCYLGLISGFLFITIGQRHRGLEMIKWAAVGYIGIQFAPGIMRILAQVGTAMRQAQ